MAFVRWFRTECMEMSWLSLLEFFLCSGYRVNLSEVHAIVSVDGWR